MQNLKVKWKIIFIVIGVIIGNSMPAALAAEEKISKSDMTAFASSVRLTLATWEDPQRVINNNYNVDAGSGYYTSAQNDLTPYIIVSLGGEYEVKRVDIFAGKNLSGIYGISVSETGADWLVAKDQITLVEGQNSIDLSGVGLPFCKYVKVFHVSGQDELYLAEIDVYGVKAENETEQSILIKPEEITATASSSAESLGVPMEAGGTRYYGCTPEFTLDGNLYGSWWTADNTDESEYDWIAYDLGKEWLMDQVLCYYTSQTGYDIDIYTSNDGLTWNYIKTQHMDNTVDHEGLQGKYGVIDLQGIQTQYIKFQKVSAPGEGEEWIVGEMLFQAFELESTQYYILQDEQAINIDRLLSGTLQVVKPIYMQDEQSGIVFAGLYDTSDWTMHSYVTKPLELSAGMQEVSLELEVDQELTGLPSQVNGDIENFAKKATPYLMSNNGYELQPSEGHVATYAIDDDPDTYANAAGEWAWTFLLELDEVREIEQIVVTFAEDMYPINYTIMVSQNNEDWETVASVKDNQQSGTFSFDFDSKPVKYIRIRDDLEQVGVRQMGIGNIEVYETSYYSTFEIRTFVISDLEQPIPLVGTVDILGNEKEIVNISTKTDYEKECTLSMDLEGNMAVEFPDDMSIAEPILLSIARNGEIVFCGVLQEGEYRKPLTHHFEDFKPADEIQVSISGAFLWSETVIYNEELVWEEFLKEYNQWEEDELNMLFEKYSSYIDSAYEADWNRLSKQEKSRVYAAILNSTIDSFNELKIIMDDEIKKILEEKEENSGSSGGSGGGYNSGNKHSVSSVIAVLPEEKVEEQNEMVVMQENDIFSDMDGYEWAEESVNGLFQLGIVQGTEEGMFSPGDSVTRAEFIKMLVAAMAEVDSGAVCGFQDIPSDSWAYPYVATAYQLGLVKGIEKDYFGANEPINRQDAAVLLYRFCRYFEIEFSNNQIVEFTDLDIVADYAIEAVKKLGTSGVMSGIGNGQFAPYGQCNRAMAAKMIYEVL